MDVIYFVLRHHWLVIGLFVAYLAVVSYVLVEIAGCGDDHWLWIPFVLVLTFIAVPLYFIHKFNRAKDEMLWEKRKMIADEAKGRFNPRKIKTYAELSENYYKSKVQKMR